MFTVDWWERLCFEMSWTRHGGSGLSRSYADLLAMPIDHLIRDIDRVHDRLKGEVAAMEKAHAAASGRVARE